MRIAYFAEIFPSRSETWVHHEIDELERLGCQIRVFATHRRPRDVPSELKGYCDKTSYLPELRKCAVCSVKSLLKFQIIKLIIKGFIANLNRPRLAGQLIRDTIYSCLLYKPVSDFKPDFLFAHFAGTRTNLAMLLFQMTGVPFGFKMHAADVFGRCILLGEKVNLAHVVLTISNYNIEFMKRNYPYVNVDKIQRHPCGIPLDKFKLRVLHKKTPLPTYLAVGRLVKMKGFDVLLKASRVLVDRGFSHKIVIVGEGPEKSNLEDLCFRLGLNSLVSFFGYLPPREVRDLLYKCDAFVLPSLWDRVSHTQDGIPVALMEAMAAGTPVVSTWTSGIPELIANNVNGILTIPGDCKSLADGLQKVWKIKPEERTRMIVNARRKIETDHDIKKLTEELYLIFCQAMDSQRFKMKL